MIERPRFEQGGSSSEPKGKDGDGETKGDNKTTTAATTRGQMITQAVGGAGGVDKTGTVVGESCTGAVKNGQERDSP